MRTTSLLLLPVGFVFFSLPAAGDDWPGFHGADRTNISREKGLLKAWPKGGPKLLWTFKNAGIGFSGPAIVGDRLYLMGARKDKGGKYAEELFCLDVTKKDKQELWSVPLGPMFTWKGNSYGDGPRATPTVDGTYVYALGGQGELVCVNTTDQKVVWRKNLIKDFNGKYMNLWGYCESPLVDGDQLVCTPGGKDGSIVALNKKTGAVIWRTKDLTEEATFGSMVVANLSGVRQFVQTTFKGSGEGGQIVGVGAKDGTLLWHFEQPKFSDVDVCATPIVHGNQVYLTAGRNAGCTLLQITGGPGKGFKVKSLYTKPPIRRVMDNEYGGVVLVDGHVYGYTGSRAWVCQDWKTGKAIWTSMDLGKGSLTCAGGQLYLYTEDEGEVALVDATPTGWKEHGRFQIPEKSNLPQTHKGNSGAKIWTQPVVANGRLYLRDQEYLFCYDVRAAGGKK
jgi:outer membrane protein assembly factor BamB